MRTEDPPEDARERHATQRVSTGRLPKEVTEISVSFTPAVQGIWFEGAGKFCTALKLSI